MIGSLNYQIDLVVVIAKLLKIKCLNIYTLIQSLFSCIYQHFSKQIVIMILYLPYIQSEKKSLGSGVKVVYYNAVSDLPEICGGRNPEFVAHRSFSFKQACRISEKYGSAFQVSANSCFPQLTPSVEKLCKVMIENSSILSVARLEFALLLKDKFPDLRLGASCIMTLYSPVVNILESSVFDSVCGPQHWNYDIEKMIDVIPRQHRSKVHYILNSACRYHPKYCKQHYEIVSKRYQECSYTPPVRCIMSENDLEIPVKKKPYPVLVKSLLNAGFVSFKFEGRERMLDETINYGIDLQKV